MIRKKKVSEFDPVDDINNFEVAGWDRRNNKSAKASMEQLKGNAGATPNLNFVMGTLPYGNLPTVEKSGTTLNPVFTVKFPLAKNGDKPVFQTAEGYIQYRYESESTWHNLISINDLKLRFSDLTDTEKTELKGEAFLYEDFTAEQLDDLRLTWEKLTPEQRASLKGEKGNPGDSAFVTWQSQEENAGKTYADYEAWLRSPATEAAEISETLNANQPRIRTDENGVLTWWVWNLEAGDYIDTTLPARGAEGKPLKVSSDGYYMYWDEVTQDYEKSDVEAAVTVDLENVPVSFVEAEERENVESGETVPTAFAKLKRWFSSFGSLAWKSSISNADISDNAISQSKIADLTTTLSGKAKGNAEGIALSSLESSNTQKLGGQLPSYYAKKAIHKTVVLSPYDWERYDDIGLYGCLIYDEDIVDGATISGGVDLYDMASCEAWTEAEGVSGVFDTITEGRFYVFANNYPTANINYKYTISL